MGKIIDKEINTESLKYIILTILASGINIITNIIYGRIFTVNEFAIISTFQALLSNIAVLMTPLQVMICRSIARGNNSNRNDVSEYFSLVIVMNTIQALLLFIFNQQVSNYLYLSIVDYCLFVILTILNNLNIIANGFIQGQKRFLLLGWAGVLLYATKMVFSILLEKCTLGPIAVIVAFSIALISSLILLFAGGKGLSHSKKPENRFNISLEALKSYMKVLFLYFVVSIFANNGDVLIANLFCSQEEIGLFSVASLLSKTSLFFIATPLATMLLPKVAENLNNKEVRERHFRKTLLITLLLAIVCGVILLFVGNVVIRFFYGLKYESASVYLLPCVVFSTILCVYWIVYNFALATTIQTIFTIISSVAVFIGVCLIFIFKMDIFSIAYVLSGVMLISIISTLLFCFKKVGEPCAGN